MREDGYLMPERKSQFCTLKWMIEVYQMKCYCPKEENRSNKFCPYPPSKY